MELADPTAHGVRWVWASRQQPSPIWGPGDHSQTTCIHDVPLLTECQECWEKWLAYRVESGTASLDEGIAAVQHQAVLVRRKHERIAQTFREAPRPWHVEFDPDGQHALVDANASPVVQGRSIAWLEVIAGLVNGAAAPDDWRTL